MIETNIGVLLTNVGSPAGPNIKAVRRYLKEFLSDPRIIELPKALWWPILHGIILRLRPRQSSKLYQSIWTRDGAPLLVHSHSVAQKLQGHLKVPVALGMHYGSPSIATALKKLLAHKIKKIIILPLFPQYSATTSAASFDKVADALKKIRHLPEIVWISSYAARDEYIAAIAGQIKKTEVLQGKPKHLLFSFHGIPLKYTKAGDPYIESCHQTTQRITDALGLATHEWSIAFQSRLGRLEWASPYTDVVLKSLGSKGLTDLQVICPGFAVDCLETLEEIAIRGKEQFMSSGGKSFYYVPALNDAQEQIDLLAKIIQDYC